MISIGDIYRANPGCSNEYYFVYFLLTSAADCPCLQNDNRHCGSIVCSTADVWIVSPVVLAGTRTSQFTIKPDEQAATDVFKNSAFGSQHVY